ncbi:MAG: outer membrane protein assembly factor BamB family protein [Planctomycetota bacterium]|jgi:hypothetical protein
MTGNSDNKSNNESMSLWARTAQRMAVVGGVFSVIVATLLAVNYVRRTVFDERRIAELDRLKIEILSQPNDEQLMSRIRDLDLRVRRERIRRLDFSHKGIRLLAAGLVTLLVGIMWAAGFSRKMPSPALQGDVRAKQVEQRAWARRAVTAGTLLLAAGALLLGLKPQVDFAGPSSEMEPDQIWPVFRGPGGMGISVTTNIPTEWNGKTGDGILWKKQVPLPGHNSPIVWTDHVFVSGGDANERQVYCYDALSGRLLWQHAVETEAGKTSEPLDVMEDTGLAAPTCVTDGKRACAIFADGDVGCFDFRGKQLWTRGLGVPDSAYGYSSSLAMYRSLILIQYDQATEDDEKSKVMALNVLSGQTVWETKRPVGSSWASPVVAIRTSL